MLTWHRRKRHALAVLASAAIIGTGALAASAGAASATTSATFWHHDSASIDLTHSANPAVVDAVGNVTLTYTARNTGQTTLSGVVISDSTPGVSALTCPSGQPAVLQPGATLTCTATYKITQSDLDNARRIVSNAKVVGTSSKWGHHSWYGGTTVCDTSQTTIQARSLPAITLDKTADKAKATKAGEVITYTFSTRNTGNVTLNNVKVTDPKTGLSALSCTPAQPAVLAPSATLVCTGKYTVTQADIESTSGQITNTATATGTPTVGSPVTATDTVTIPVDRTPAITLTKVADKETVGKVGEVVNYQFTAQNTGNVQLRDVRITDPKPGLSALKCAQPVTLAVGGKLVCTAQYTVTQADIDDRSGVIANTATVVGTPPVGAQVKATASEKVTVAHVPAIDLVKTADKQTVSKVGEQIKYTLVATNTGTVTLRGVNVTDRLPGVSDLSCSATLPTTLAPGAKVTCTGTYAVTQADIDNGRIRNDGRARGASVFDGTVVVDTDFTVVNVVVPQPPAIGLTKTADKQTVSKVGEQIKYTLVATNTGKVALRDVTVTDQLPGVSALSCAPALPARLAPGEKVTCTGTYAATQADITKGQITNDGRTRGVSVVDGTAVVANASVTVKVVIPPAPSIALTKTADTEIAAVGDTIKYTLEAKNTGNVALSNVVISDPLPGLSALTCAPAQPATLAPGAKLTCTATYVVTRSDGYEGKVVNTSTVKGTDPSGKIVTDKASVTVPTKNPS